MSLLLIEERERERERVAECLISWARLFQMCFFLVVVAVAVVVVVVVAVGIFSAEKK